MKYIFVSLILHSIVLILSMLVIFSQLKPPTLAIEIPTYIASVASREITPKVVPQKTSLVQKNLSIPKNNLRTLGKENIKKISDRLLITIHAAIAAQQIYPKKAQWLQETGTVELTFLIAPNGTINEIKILHSSGFFDLDQAAILAAKKASPITILKNELKDKRYFTIDIVFE